MTGRLGRVGARLDRGAEVVLVVVLAVLVGVSLVGMGLAVAGRYTAVPVVLGGAVVAVALVVLWDPRHPVPPSAEQSSGRVRGWWWALAAVLALAAGVFGAQWSSEHVPMDRDPALYLNGAQWLHSRGDLVIPRADDPFTRAGGFEVDSPGVTIVVDDQRGFQSLHLYAVWGALMGSIAGTDGLARTPAVVGGLFLLVLFALVSRVLRAAPALFATALFALLLPTVLAFRDFFSEMPLGLMALGAAWLLDGAIASIDHGTRVAPRRAALAGAVAGVAVMARIDSPLSLIGFAVFLALSALRSDSRRETRGVGRISLAFAAGLVPGLVAALVDGRLRSTAYLDNHRNELVVQGALVAAGLVGALALVAGHRRWPAIGAWLGRQRRWLAMVGIVIVVGGALALAFVRPHVEVARDLPDASLTRVIQKREGLAVDGTRSYAERSFVWLSWYLGPLGLATAVAGGVLLLAESARRRLGRSTLLFVCVALPPLLGYLARPSIFPDHPWATRRFLPLAFPLLCTLAALVLDRLWGRDGDLWPLVRRAAAIMLGAALLIAPLQVLVPLRDTRPFSDRATLLEQVCDALPADAAVLLLRGISIDPRTLVQPVRGFCAVPAATAARGGEEVDEAEVARLARAWEREGRQLWLVGGDPEDLEALGGRPQAHFERFDDRTLSYTLSRRPDTLRADPITLVVGPVAEREREAPEE